MSKIIEIARIESGIPQIAKHRSVIGVGAVLGFDVDLAARLGTVFRIVQRAVDAILLDSVLRNLQAGLRFLGLLLNAAGIDAVNLKVVVVSGAAGEANRSLVAAAVILSEGREEGEAGPVASIVGEVSDLLGVYDRRRLSGTAFRRSCGCLYLDFFCNRADFKLRYPASASARPAI